MEDTKRIRKRHSNSKLGCANCRRRQTKCDETLPICLNCLKRNDACSYLFLPSQEFQQLAGLKTSSDLNNDKLDDSTIKDQQQWSNLGGKGLGPIKKEISFISWEKDSKPKRRKPTKVTNKIKKVTDIFELLSNDQLTEESDFSGTQHNIITSTSVASLVKPQTIGDIWGAFDNSSDNTGEFLPDQPYIQMNTNLRTDVSPPDIEKSSLSYYMNDSTFERQFYENESSSLPTAKKNQHLLPVDNESQYATTPNYSTDHNDTDTDSDAATLKSDFYDGYYGSNEESLPGARETYKTLKINRDVDSKWFDPFFNNVQMFFALIGMKVPSNLNGTLNSSVDIDAEIEQMYFKETNFETIFCTVIRKSLLVFVHDVFKNILLKQKNIIPSMNVDMRVRVCRLCEDFSMTELNDLKKIIITEYVPHYSSFEDIQREVMIVCFFLLSMCAVYHYNSGYRQSMSIEQSIQSVKFLGTFSAGMFSVIINENDREKVDQIHFIRIFSKNIYLLAKFIIVPNYNALLFDEIFGRFQSLNLHRYASDTDTDADTDTDTDTDTDSRWMSDFTNLNLFFEKHSIFLKKYKEGYSIMGFDKGYMIRAINEWYQIFPTDLGNLAQCTDDEVDSNTQISFLLHLTFLGLKFYLDAIFPSIRSMVRFSFSGVQKLEYNKISNLMRAYRLLKIKEHKVFAIYVIRIFTFFSTRYDILKNILSNTYIPEFSGFPDMSASERCDRLLNKWKLGNVFHERFLISLDVFKGSYIDKNNYPSVVAFPETLPPRRKIHFKNSDEIIEDFERTNSGLFSDDYDPRLEKIAFLATKASMMSLEDLNGALTTTLAYNSDDEVNPNTMRNFWKIEQYLKLGYE